MKNDIPRLFPLWLVLLLVVLFAMCGCRTGGTRLNPNSAGTIIRSSDIRPNFQPLPPVPITPPRSTPTVTSNAVRSTPTPPEPQSVKANPVVINPEPAGELESFTPTISPTPAKLPPVKLPPVKLPPIKAEVKSSAKLIEGDGGCVVITDDETAGKGPQIAGPCEVTPVKESTSSWLSLFVFYVACFLGLIILWVIYDIIKDAIEMKKQGSPMKKHLENLKKPAKGTRAARKTIKKKSTKKKSK